MMGMCPPSQSVRGPDDKYADSLLLYGAKNITEALVFIGKVTHPQTGLAIELPTDDESVNDALAAAFSALNRVELNKEGFEEKLADALQTILYTFKQPVLLQVDGSYTVGSAEPGDGFEGSAMGLIRWVRNKETTLITPDLDPGMGPKVRRESISP